MSEGAADANVCLFVRAHKLKSESTPIVKRGASAINFIPLPCCEDVLICYDQTVGSSNKARAR